MRSDELKLDLYLPRPHLAEVGQRARQAEDEGFDGLFVEEGQSDPFLRLAIAANSSRQITLGTSIALAFRRSPMATAIAARDLQVRSGGRFILGLGARIEKKVQRRRPMAYDRPAARMREYVAAVRASWAAFDGDGSPAFRRAFHTLDYLSAAGNPGPMPSQPPIYLTAMGPRMFRTAGEVADGCALAHPLHSVSYIEHVAEPEIAAGLRASGRGRGQFSLGVSVLAAVGVGSDGLQEREAVRRQLALQASTPACRPVLELHGWQGAGERVSELLRQGDVAAMAKAVPDEMLEAFAVIADSWPEAITATRERYAGVVDRVTFHTAPPVGVLRPESSLRRRVWAAGATVSSLAGTLERQA